MSIALVETKLLPPRLRRDAVARPGSTAAPAAASTPRLTLVSAPAGFGKTTLLGAWLAAPSDAAPRSPGCRSTSATGEPASFWTYVLTALDRAVPGTGAGRARRCSASGQAPSRRCSPAVVNELSVLARRARPRPGRLPPGRRARRSRPGWRSCSSTCRRSCGWSSAPAPTRPCRWPGCGPAASSSRSAPRTCASPTTRPAPTSTTVNGLDLAADDVAALGARTEGWVAALQLAALSLRDRDDPARFIAGFAGDDRYVVDYLVDEVLDRQPDERAPVPARHLDPGPAHRAAVRRGHRRRPGAGRDDARAAGAAATCSSSRSTTSAAGTATTTSSPTSCAPTCSQERPDDVPELHRRASRWYAESGRRRGRRPPRPRRRGRRRRGRAGRAGHPGPAPGPARGRHPALGRRAARRRRPGPAGARDRAHRRPDGQQRVRRRRATGSRDLRELTRRGPVRSWWSSTPTSSPGCPAAIEIVPGRRWR